MKNLVGARLPNGLEALARHCALNPNGVDNTDALPSCSWSCSLEVARPRIFGSAAVRPRRAWGERHHGLREGFLVAGEPRPTDAVFL